MNYNPIILYRIIIMVENKWTIKFKYNKINKTKLLLIDKLDLKFIIWVFNFINTVNKYQKILKIK